MENKNLNIIKISDNVYRLNEKSQDANVDAYLIIGNAQAVVIDGLCKMGEALFQAVKKLTDLPVIMLLTHGHFDHAGEGMKVFLKYGYQVYVSESDRNIIRADSPNLSLKNIKYFTEENVFLIGNDRINVIPMPGHTLGSVFFYLEKENLIFSGDSVGSGNIWLQLPESTKLISFCENLHKMKKFLTKHPGCKIYPGHCYQIIPYESDGQDWLTEKYIDSLLEITEYVIKHPQAGKVFQYSLPGRGTMEGRMKEGMVVKEFCYDEQKIY